MVEIQIIEKTSEYMRFIVSGVNTPFVNALRRIILTEVPAMAIDEIVILENSSILTDEILSHRMGFIPLKTDLDSYSLPEDCKCESEFGCSLCRANLTLEIEANEKITTVYSGDIIPENPDIAPVSDKIPLAKLAQDQKIKMEAYARLGKGKKHAKWQPVSMCVYSYLPKIKIDPKLCDSCGKCVKICPENILKQTDDGIKVQNEINCTLCMDCVDACPKDSATAVNVSWDDKTFIFKIESTGALPVERIVMEATKILDNEIKEFSNQLKKGNKK
ncbi:MAG: DNA-directed RNA polymerase subunit D [Candidatus Bathyarchaeota archaeon]|nr:DNA-directed RNA polymerase subunit D [Candidatus Bathyarchaeum tardum]WGM89591.1 MAG: DNA-directed RNA polymerase subunit D [Candidatus Bathyarchaeum tardum]WNZ30306.1 MAG: DNA-directed RNA polymerase subunit D [Candidatus Bathyarchaeota archaeon]